LLIYYDQHQALRASIKQTMGRGLVTYSWWLSYNLSITLNASNFLIVPIPFTA
jgi:hypothetical protein